jgi:methylated-DNA-protein-cysteine methyltransferase-like protein
LTQLSFSRPIIFLFRFIDFSSALPLLLPHTSSNTESAKGSRGNGAQRILLRVAPTQELVTLKPERFPRFRISTFKSSTARTIGSCISNNEHNCPADEFRAIIPGAVTWDPVYKLVKQIPRGRVTTYGALAGLLRLRGGARTAGRAMAATPKGRGIPWHRVLGANGKLLLREPHAALQRKLLESEGITVLESRVNIKQYLWQPKLKKRAKTKPKSASA